MDFATLPPETNSGRMYEGLGSGSMLEAVTAWEELAIRLRTATADYRAVTSKLAAGCDEPVSTAITAVAIPYIDWLNAAAAQAEQAAAQAKAAANAYETAFAAVVPPAAIDANRATHASLATTNFLGQSGPAIAELEAEYEQMWVQDADAMYAYAGCSAEASTMTPFASPSITAATTWVEKSGLDLVSAGRQVMTVIPDALQALSSSPPTTLNTALASVTAPLSKLTSLTGTACSAVGYLNYLNKASALQWLLPNQGGALGPPITAKFARATSIATMSVPPAWTTSTPLTPFYRGTVA